MRHVLLKTAAAAVGALALFAAHCPAKAVSPWTLGQAPQLLIQIQDMETEAVEENLRPNLNPKSTDKQSPQDDSTPKSRSMGGNDGDIEDETIKEIVPE